MTISEVAAFPATETAVIQGTAPGENGCPIITSCTDRCATGHKCCNNAAIKRCIPDANDCDDDATWPATGVGSCRTGYARCQHCNELCLNIDGSETDRSQCASEPAMQDSIPAGAVGAAHTVTCVAGYVDGGTWACEAPSAAATATGGYSFAGGAYTCGSLVSSNDCNGGDIAEIGFASAPAGCRQGAQIWGFRGLT